MAHAIEIQLKDLAGRVHQVRRWLLLLVGLRIVAAGVLFFLGFLLVFAVADHRWQFGPFIRLVALGALIAGLAALAVFLVRMLWAHASVRQAANYIETRRQFDQQLITAIEYHECPTDYPYSQALAERTVANVAERSADIDFLDDVPKWQVYTSATIVAVGSLIILASLVAQSAYFVRYFTRLTQPFSSLEALSATRLEAITGDLVIEPEQNVELAAKVTGHPPDHAVLRVVIPHETEGEAVFREVDLTPTEAGDELRLAAVSSYPKGSYRYRFETGNEASSWHTLDVMKLPAIAAIYATVTPMPEVTPYEEAVHELQLEVAEGAHVELAVEVSEPVTSVSATALDGHIQDVKPVAPTRFNYAFDAIESGEIRFSFTNTKGMHNQTPQELAVTIRPDELPSFQLITPGGDYLATNVASIPFEMKARDERGLASADLIIEIPNAPPIRVAAEMGEDATTAVARHLLELEDYPLNLGDTILFYAEATERKGTPTREAQSVASDVYFIEIRPYRVMHHQLEPSLPHEFSKQGLESQGHTTLATLLEYTRAILKKSWSLATKPTRSVVDDGHVTALQDDLTFANEQATKIAGNEAVPLDDGQRQSLRIAASDFASAKDFFAAREIAAGLPPIKDAYARISQLAVALHKANMTGSGGSNRSDRDRLKLEEQVHLSRYKKENVEWELNRLANQVAELEKEQKELQQRFARFLKAYGKQEGSPQETTDEHSSYEAQKPQNPSSKPGEGGGGNSRQTVDGSLETPTGASGSSETRQKDGHQATAVDQLEIMRALQRTLREKGQQLAENLNAVDNAGTTEANQDRAMAREHLVRSFGAMNEFDKAIKDALFAANIDDPFDRAEDALDQAAYELTLAANLLELDALISKQAEAAKQLRDQATHMADLARALELPKDALDLNALNHQLQDAIVTFQQQGGPQYVSSVGGLDMPPSYIALAQSLVPGAAPYDGPNPTNVERAQVARWLAVQFGTMALDAEKQRGALRDSEVSDSSFSPLEQVFFTEAARYEGGGQ